MKILILSAVSLVFLLPTHPVRADIYQCTDVKGNTSYRTEPCPEGSRKRVIKSRTQDKGESGVSGSPGNDYGSGEYKKVEIISRGSLVDLIDYVVPYKYTVFLFYADWCTPCKPAKKKLARLAESVDTLAVRELDIVNWDYPLTKYYNIGSIPYFIVYGPDGTYIERGSRVSKELLKKIAPGG